MKTEFVQPSFSGPRFSKHTLPIEVACDLAAYETFISELAKCLYLKENPKRERAPRGFTAEFHLHLEKIEGGSTKPVLAIVAADGLALSGVAQYFERARDLIADCVAAPEGQLPPGFPKDLLAYFNRFGRSLRSDESLTLPRANNPPAVLTSDRRKELVLTACPVYEREFEMSGTIAEVDWERSIFRLRLGNGKSAVIPMTDGFHSLAREFGGRPRHQMTVKGVGAYDSWDELQKVLAVSSVGIQKDYEIAERFEALSSLYDRWQDQAGSAQDKAKLLFVWERMEGHYPEELPLPAIVATAEGGLLFEWDLAGCPSLEIRFADMTGNFRVIRTDQPTFELKFSLTNEQDWERFFQFLRERAGSKPTPDFRKRYSNSPNSPEFLPRWMGNEAGVQVLSEV